MPRPYISNMLVLCKGRRIEILYFVQKDKAVGWHSHTSPPGNSPTSRVLLELESKKSWYNIELNRALHSNCTISRL